jgi:hypothetical protein
MINKILIYTISITILLLILLFINRIINYKKNKTTTTTTQHPKELRPIIISNSIEDQFYWGNDEMKN